LVSEGQDLVFADVFWERRVGKQQHDRENKYCTSDHSHFMPPECKLLKSIFQRRVIQPNPVDSKDDEDIMLFF
jgi:hypothetical protein